MPVKLYEWDKNETGWTWIEVTPNKVINLILRSLNNLIHVNDNNEVYVDLQLEDWIENTDSLPIGVNVGRVIQADGRPVTWTLISWQTTSWDRVKILYGDDKKIRVDNGTGEWKILQYELTAWPWIAIYDEFNDAQWPCQEGWHIPSPGERQALILSLNALWIDITNNNCLKTYCKMPAVFYRKYQDGTTSWDVTGYYWTSKAYENWPDRAYCLIGISWNSLNPRANGMLIRPFKNKASIPTSSRTTLIENSNWWVYHDSINWQISITNYTWWWITIADKNLGATQVYDINYAPSDDTIGYFYQRWNNYGFPPSWNITTSSVQVDTTGYQAPNYYSDNTFIIWNLNRSSVDNKNLRGGLGLFLENAIVNAWVLSVNWKTGHVHIEQPNVCEITVQIVDASYIWTATKTWDLVDGATIIWHSNGLQGLQWLSIAWVSYTVLNWIDALDNWTHFYGIYREWYWVIIYSFNNN